MAKAKTSSEVQPDTKLGGGMWWTLALLPLLLLGGVLAFLVATGGGLKALAGPPLEQLTLEKITLPEPGVIQIEVINDGPQTVTIAQVSVDDAYWQFEASPSPTLPRLGRATIMIHYPWVNEEAHEVVLHSSIGTTFGGEIAVAVETPAPSFDLFSSFGLIGIYVGIVPITLGLLWYPLMRNMGKQAMNFILSLTVGLLIYLAVGTWLDALEFAAELPAFWQGVPLTIFVALLTLGGLLAIGSVRRGEEQSALNIAYMIALGIGIHNLGEGLAIGAAYALGEAALGTFLILGFTLHNITEGVGIAAPVVKQSPGLKHFALLILLAGGPAILGTWIGGFSFNPVLATIFLGVGVGAILQVVWEVGRLVARESERMALPLVNPVNLSGLITGIALMYFTAFFVKF